MFHTQQESKQLELKQVCEHLPCTPSWLKHPAPQAPSSLKHSCPQKHHLGSNIQLYTRHLGSNTQHHRRHLGSNTQPHSDPASRLITQQRQFFKPLYQKVSGAIGCTNYNYVIKSLSLSFLCIPLPWGSGLFPFNPISPANKCISLFFSGLRAVAECNKKHCQHKDNKRKKKRDHKIIGNALTLKSCWVK